MLPGQQLLISAWRQIFVYKDKIRWSWDHLIFIMGISVLVRKCFYIQMPPSMQNTARPETNGQSFVGKTFQYIFLKGNCCLLIKTLLKFVPRSLIDHESSLVQVMVSYQIDARPSIDWTNDDHACMLNLFAKLHWHISFCWCYLLNGRCWGIFLV